MPINRDAAREKYREQAANYDRRGPGSALLANVRGELINRADLKPGDEVTVWGFAYRDGKPNMTWNRIVQANGTLVPMPGGAKNEKLGRFLATYGKEQLSPEEYEEFKNLLNYTGRS